MKRITVREIEKLGGPGVDPNELFIDNLEVRDDEVVGEVGRGFYYLPDGLNPERIVVGWRGSALAVRPWNWRPSTPTSVSSSTVRSARAGGARSLRGL